MLQKKKKKNKWKKKKKKKEKKNKQTGAENQESETKVAASSGENRGRFIVTGLLHAGVYHELCRTDCTWNNDTLIQPIQKKQTKKNCGGVA